MNAPLRHHHNQRESKQERMRSVALLALRIWALIGAGILFVALGVIIDKIALAVEILIIALVISFLISPLVTFLESKGVKRAIGTLIAYVIGVLVLIALFILVFPVIAEQVVSFAGALPGYVDRTEQWATQLYNNYSVYLADTQVQAVINKFFNSISSTALGIANSSATGLLVFGGNVVSTIAMIFMALVVAFWLSMDFPKFHREIMIIAGPQKAEELEIMGAVFSRAMGGYVKGLLITSACTGVLAGVGFFLLGLPYAGLLGLMTGILNIIPFVGPWIGGAIAALVGLFVTPLTALIAVIITVVAQQITDTFISPKVMQSAVAVHPLLVILGLSVGGALGGVVGMIFVVPLIAAVKGVFTYYFEKRTNRQLISKDGAVFKGQPYNDEDGNPIPAYDATGGTKYYAGEFALNDGKHRERAKRVEKEVEAQKEAEKQGSLVETAKNKVEEVIEEVTEGQDLKDASSEQKQK